MRRPPQPTATTTVAETRQEAKLPYATTAASFFADQGPPRGSSFLGNMFQRMAGRSSPPNVTASKGA